MHLWHRPVTRFLTSPVRSLPEERRRYLVHTHVESLGCLFFPFLRLWFFLADSPCLFLSVSLSLYLSVCLSPLGSVSPSPSVSVREGPLDPGDTLTDEDLLSKGPTSTTRWRRTLIDWNNWNRQRGGGNWRTNGSVDSSVWKLTFPIKVNRVTCRTVGWRWTSTLLSTFVYTQV